MRIPAKSSLASVNRKGDGRTDCRCGIGDGADLKGRRRATGHADWSGAPSRWRRCAIADSPCDEVATYECRIWVIRDLVQPVASPGIVRCAAGSGSSRRWATLKTGLHLTLQSEYHAAPGQEFGGLICAREKQVSNSGPSRRAVVIETFVLSA
jgi:hypothetical protein